MVVLSLALVVFLLFSRKHNIYGSIALGIASFMVLFLLDAGVVVRLSAPQYPYPGIDFSAEYYRLTHLDERLRVILLFNVVVFAILGFFLSEFLSSTKRFSAWHRIIYVTFAAFGFSLCIEFLQLILHKGFFELTDLVTNSTGGFIGAGLSLLGRKVLGIEKK